MATHRESRAIARPAEEIFDIVADVERYPEFVPLIREARIFNRVEDTYETEQSLALGLLMVSRIPYFSFKVWPDKVPFFWILVVVLAIVPVAAHPPSVLLGISLVYVASGPGIWLWRRLRRRGGPAAPETPA